MRKKKPLSSSPELQEQSAASSKSDVGKKRKAAKKKPTLKVQQQSLPSVEAPAKAGSNGSTPNPEEEENAAVAPKPKPAPRPHPYTSFSQLGLASWLVKSCENLGMRYPTDIQGMSIPSILKGRNVAGNAKTGSGKTACYCLPTLHFLSQDPYGVFTLVLTPVRELAFQVSENFKALGKGISVETVEVVGGREMQYQSQMIAERKHVVVATPGRLADLLRGDPMLTQSFNHLRILVLDEADKLLTTTFEEPLAEILSALPKKRQTLLFSATITRSIEKLKAKLEGSAEGNPEKQLLLLDANPDDESLENMTQKYVFVPKVVQMCYVHYLLKEHFPEQSCIIFAATIYGCQLLTTMLEVTGFSVSGLHSLQTQRNRQASLGKFRAGRANILVATDVAGRGLDIPKVAVVLNIGLPVNVDDYIHRAGRTARAGRPGTVISIMTEDDVYCVKAIEDRLGKQLELHETDEEAALKLVSQTTKALQKAELLLAEVGFAERVQEMTQKRTREQRGDRSDQAPETAKRRRTTRAARSSKSAAAE